MIPQLNSTQLKYIDKDLIKEDIRSRNLKINKQDFDELFDLCLISGKIYKVAYPIRIDQNINIQTVYEGDNATVKFIINDEWFQFNLKRLQGKEPWKIVGGNYFDLLCSLEKFK